MKVGTATLKLNKIGRDDAKGKSAKKGQKKGKKSGKTRPVVYEFMEERQGKDVRIGGSIDHTRSHLNEYWVCDEIRDWAEARGVSPTSGEAVVDWIEERIDEYSELVYRPRHGQGVRSNAIQAISLIVKPPARDIAGWSPDRLALFFQLSGDYFDEAFGGRRNLVARAMHRDEGFEDPVTGEFLVGEHEHRVYIPWTEDGRLCAKEVHGPTLWKKLNREYADYMNTHGFPEIEATEILDYEEIVKLDGEIEEAEAAGDEETAQAKREAKEAMRAEAYAIRQQHRQERNGLASGAPAAAYRGMCEAQAIRDDAVAQAEGARAMAEQAEEAYGKWVEHIGHLEEQRDLLLYEDTFEHDGVTVIGVQGAARMRNEALEEAEQALIEAERTHSEVAGDMAAARQMVDEAAFEAEVMLHGAEAELAARERDVAANEAGIAGREREVAKRERVLSQSEAFVAERTRSLDAYAEQLSDVGEDTFYRFVRDATANEDGMTAVFSLKASDGRSVDDELREREPRNTGFRQRLKSMVMTMAGRLMSAMILAWRRDRQDALENAKSEHARQVEADKQRFIDRWQGDDVHAEHGREAALE